MEFANQSCQEFTEVLASRAPVPGGGGASALVGALGVALGEMVGNLTVGKKKYAAVEDDIRKLMQKTAALRNCLLELIDRDAEAFEPLSKAYGLPKETEAEKAEKARVLEEALETACAVPLEIMEKCCEAIALHQEFAEKGSRRAISDVGVGVACCRAALAGASLNIFINTKSMANRERAEALNQKANQMLDQYMAVADKIFMDVRHRFD